VLSSGTKKPNQIGSAIAELARITNVNLREFTVDVLTDVGQLPLVDLPFAVPYASNKTGAGLNFMPEIGDQCVVFIPGDGTGPFVMGFIISGRTVSKDYWAEDGDVVEGPDSEGPDYSGDRPPLEPGDICLTTSDDNFMIVRRGGVVQLGATPLAQTMYIPIENIIRHYFQRYQAISPLGSIEWGHASIAGGVSDDDETAVLISFNAKEIAQDSASTVEVRVGRLNNEVLDTDEDGEHVMASEADHSGLSGDYDTGVLSVTVNPGEEGVKYIFQLDKAGNNFIQAAGKVHVEIGKSLFVKATEAIKLEVDSDTYISMDNAKLIEALAKEFVVQMTQAITMKAPTAKVDSPDISLGSGPAYLPVIVDRGLINWLTSHTHALPAIPTVTTPAPATTPAVSLPPVIPPPPATAFHVKAS
jgi:hypothetical protein